MQKPRSHWVTAELYEAGDVVCFTMKTLHTGIRNATASSLRLSADVRFQPASAPRDERWVSSAADGIGVPRDSAVRFSTDFGLF